MPSAPPALLARFPLVACVAVAVAVAAAYANALGAELLFDSREVILVDLRLRDLDWAGLGAILFDDYWWLAESDLYRPLTILSYAINWSVLGNGPDAAGYVAVNIVLHAVNAALVVGLARALELPRPAALATGLVFAVHPLGTEAVTNVIGRADLMVATGVLAGTLCHVLAVRTGRRAASVGVALASALAIGAKESGIVLIGVLVAYDLLVGRAPLRTRALRGYVWCLAPVAVYLACRACAIAPGAAGPSAADNPLLLLDWVPARVTAAGILLRYLWLIVWPVRLSADYSFDALPLFDGAVDDVHDVVALAAVPLLAAAVVAAVVLRRSRPAVAFAVLFFFVTFSPVANVFLLIGTILGERLAYLPSVGVLLLGGLALGRRRGAPLALAVAVVVVLLGARTAARNRDWYSAEALFASAVEVSPGSFKAHKSLAGALYLESADDAELARRIDRVIEHAETAWSIMQRLPADVGYGELLADLAFYYRTKAGLVPEAEAGAWRARAIEIYERAIEREAAAGAEPNWRLPRGLGDAYRELGEVDAALASYAAALELAPGPEVLAPLAELLLGAGRDRDALLCAIRLLTLQPDHAAMWAIVDTVYARRHPGGLTVVEQGGRKLFNTSHPEVKADLQAAARQQWEAAARLGEGEFYRAHVVATLGFDPAVAWR